MIVKDEAHVIERCLESVRPLISAWCVVDTGSNDGTQDKVQQLLGDLPGQLHQRPWFDFAHNRSESLKLAAPLADYSLVIDADDRLIVPEGFVMPTLTHDAYSLLVHDNNSRYDRLHLVRSNRNWRYEGVLHEFITCEGSYSRSQLKDVVYQRIGGGARSLDPRKFLRDAEVLQRALKTEPENARYVFYLAQSWRDAGRPELAIACYQKRAVMGGWDEEVWYSKYQIARLLEQVKAKDEAIIAAYLTAYDYRPTRAEALTRLAAFLRTRQRWPSAFLYAQAARTIAHPNDRLFIEQSVYDWQANDEFSIAAYWVGAYEQSATACRELLTGNVLPDDQFGRVGKNLAFAESKIASGQNIEKNFASDACSDTTRSRVHDRLRPAESIVERSFVVLGPFRGGTSLVTGILRALGVYTGEHFFDGGTGYCTYEAVGLRDACLSCFDEIGWKKLGTFEDRVEHLRQWAVGAVNRASRQGLTMMGGKHPTLCMMIPEVVQAWSSCSETPPTLIRVARPNSEVLASWRRQNWWPRDDVEKIVDDLIATRDDYLKQVPHVVIDFEALRSSPRPTLERFASDCDLSTIDIDVAMSLLGKNTESTSEFRDFAVDPIARSTILRSR